MGNYNLYRERFDKRDFRSVIDIILDDPRVQKRITTLESEVLFHELLLEKMAKYGVVVN